MDVRDIPTIIQRELERQGTNPFRLASKCNLPGNAIRYVLDGREPKVGRMAEICAALGLDFYIGPKRGVIKEIKEKILTPEEQAAIPPGLEKAMEDVLAAREATMLREAADNLSKIQRWVDAQGKTQPPPPKAAEPPTMRQINIVELAAAAGSGANVLDEQVTGRIAFRRTWLDRHGLDPNHCAVIGVTGESMEPTLPEGCSILVDRNRRTRRVRHIFVVRTDDGLVVKRAGKDKAGRWLILSDHPSWPPQPWPPEAEIIGEVKWTARTL